MLSERELHYRESRRSDTLRIMPKILSKCCAVVIVLVVIDSLGITTKTDYGTII